MALVWGGETRVEPAWRSKLYTAHLMSEQVHLWSISTATTAFLGKTCPGRWSRQRRWVKVRRCRSRPETQWDIINKWLNDKSTKQKKTMSVKFMYVWAKYKYTADYTPTVERTQMLPHYSVCSLFCSPVSNISGWWPSNSDAFTSCSGIINCFFCSTVTATGLDESGTCH